jgi:diguanylate cyclase (GGDEF)-like protein
MGADKETGPCFAASGGTSLIRTLIVVLAVTASGSLTAWGAEPSPLNTLHAIHTLTKAAARAGLPVAFEATVTYYNKSDVDLFVQEGREAIYVETKPNESLVAGDRVLVRGKTRDSFTPDVLSDQITLLHHGDPPIPVDANFEQLIRTQLDCLRVVIRAKVRSADAVNFGEMHGIYLKLLMNGGSIDASVAGTDASSLSGLMDADVDVTGVVSGKFDSKMQLVGILLEVSSLADVKILAHPKANPESLPITPMQEVLSNSYVQDLTRRVRVKGTITYYQPGSSAVLQNGGESLWISTHTSAPMRIGDLAIATGFPDAREGFLELSDAEIQDSNFFEPVAPQPATWRQLATWNSGDPDGHQNDLVSFEGKVMAAVREDSQDEFVLASEGKLFTAIFRHPPSNRPLTPMREISPGTRIRVTGICMAAQANSISPTEQEVPFNILLRSYDDIEIVANPSLLNVHNLTVLVGFLLALLLLGGIRAWVLERKVRYQNAESAYTERRRSHILEEINGSRPLSEIIEQITELVSFRLHGVPCWCQIVDGAKLGNCPSDLTAFRIIQEQIPARSGAPLGVIYAAFAPLAKPHADDSEALFAAAGLASLAIETRRLYSDLIHRSEFDLLTDINNRFSLERFLNEQIDFARQNAGIFGLVYIDLNDFKRVNDVHGHQAGDLYLQEVATRMKRHLRADDVLARLGGDEFAVLLTRVHNRAEVAEIALRIEQCLDGPFIADGNVVQGSASVGFALYPEDGLTKDSLLSAADAAMYVNKHMRRECNESA